MKTRNTLIILLGFVTYFALQLVLRGYEHTKSHPSINEAIVEKFNSYYNYDVKIDKFKNYTFNFTSDITKLKGIALTNPGYIEGSTTNSAATKDVEEWIKHGGYSADEPELQAAVRHFYDPTKADGSRHLTNRGTYWEGVYSNPRTDAIEWALGDTYKGESNIWSFRIGKANMILAMTEKDTNKRKEHLAEAYRCLGETLHNTADMGCPPHTRNDSHAAPLGYSGGWILGSPDPYEELFTPAITASNKDNIPDPELETYFNESQTVRSINHRLAQFTNSNFFTHETINGVGVDTYTSINKDGKYTAPLLQNLEYLDESFSFIKKFPSGREVILARDHSYFSFRGYPYVDKRAAHSQATELVPNIIHAGVNVMRLFIPHLEIEMKKTDDISDTIEINVKHIKDAEYPNAVLYEGPIYFEVNKKMHDSVLIIEKGKFKGVLPFQIKNNDLIKALIIMPGFKVSTEKELKIKMNPLWGIWYIKEVLEDSNDPAAPKNGTVFTGTKFYQILSTGFVKITNLDGSGLMQLKIENTGLSFKISGSNSTQSYSQTGNVSTDQEKWSAQTNSQYKQGAEEYFRKYTSTGSRKPLSSKVKMGLDTDDILKISQLSDK